MITIKQITRNRWVMLGTVAGLALYYFLVFHPLARRAETLDKPLDALWQELVNFSMESSSVRGFDLATIQRTHESLQTSRLAMEKVREEISARVEVEPEIRAKMDEPFFLIDFQNERQKRIEQLTALANSRQVMLDAAALEGFPDYKAEMRDPGFLWAQLSMVHHVITAAISHQVSQIKSITLLPAQLQTNVAEVSWREIPVRIELISPMTSAMNFLSAMPLRADEMKAAGFPESLPGKPAIFLDRLLLRKQTPEKPDEVSVDVVVSSFVLKSTGQTKLSQEVLP